MLEKSSFSIRVRSILSVFGKGSLKSIHSGRSFVSPSVSLRSFSRFLSSSAISSDGLTPIGAYLFRSNSPRETSRMIISSISQLARFVNQSFRSRASPLLRFHGRLHFDQIKMIGRQLDVVPPRLFDFDYRRIRKVSSYRSTLHCSNSLQQTKRILLRLQNRVNDETR